MTSILFLIQTTQRNQLKWNYLENKKSFPDFFLNASNLVSVLNIFKRKITLVADIFPKLRTPKNVVRSMSKKSRFTEPFQKQDGKGTQTLLKSERQHLYHIYWYLIRQLSCKKSLLMICKILTQFLNTTTADGKYSFLNRDNLTQPIQVQLSWKQNFLFQSFFLNIWNLV